MRSKRIVALISLSASVFLLLVFLWSDAHASDFYKPEPPPDQRQSYSQATEIQSPGINKGCQVPNKLLPDNGSLNTGSPLGVNGQSDWIDRPGNNLKLGAYVLGGVSVASFIAGGVLYVIAKDKSNQNHKTCPPGPEGIGCGMNFSGYGEFIAGVTTLAFGAASGVTSIGLFIGGEAKAKKAAEEAQRRIEISPYINPIIEKNSSTASGAEFEGAVAGIKGRF